jgi:hypothetical protein
MKRNVVSFRSNVRLARRFWGEPSGTARHCLRDLTARHSLSVGDGHLQFLEGRWYITHAGLLHIAERRRCAGIKTSVERHLSDPNSHRWVCKAVAYKKSGGKGFTGYGDADPSNVFPLVRGAEMRVAETRAVNRALRKAYAIGLCSVEELGSHAFPEGPSNNKHRIPQNGNASSISMPSLRDKLCLLIRNYELDPTLVKRYAADFCGTETLREASRDLVESFVSTISQEAANNRAALVCKLNSYNQPEEMRP